MPPETGAKGPAGKQPPPAPSLRPMLLLFAPMLLWIVLLPFAGQIAKPLRPLLDPLAAHSFQATIALLAIVSGVISTLLRFRFTDWKKVKAFQERSQRVGKQLREAMKSQNKHLIQKAREEQMGMMREQQAMMTENMKPMLLLMVVSLPFFMWIYATVPPPGVAVSETISLVEGCPPNATLEISHASPDGQRNISSCGNVTAVHRPALDYVADHCPYRSEMGPFRDHLESCIASRTGGLFRVPPLSPGDSGSRHPNDLALGIMPWWIVWYMLITLPASHLVQKAMEDRMRRKEKEATEASGGMAA
ncbi:MAG: EMC3/TMCO1 family protein [Halobacteria archaeon]